MTDPLHNPGATEPGRPLTRSPLALSPMAQPPCPWLRCRPPWRARSLSAVLAGALALPLLGGCAARPPGAAAGRAVPAGQGLPMRPTPARLPVVTTILPITLFTRTVAGDCAEVTPLIPPASSPHAFQARPADLLALRRARVLVINGLGMEGFLERLIRAAENPTLLVIDANRDVTPLSLPAADHGDHGHDGEPHGRERGEGEARAGAPIRNPHSWLDPLRAVQQLETIRDGLIRADPACAAGYRRRAAAAITQLRQLDRDIAAQLAPYRGRSFVAFHDVAPYFAARYGLKAAFLVDVPEVNPSPRDLRRVAALVQNSQLRALLSEPQQGDRSFNALARDLGVRLSLFDPLETAEPGAPLDLSTYLRVMRRNTTDLRQAFGGPSPAAR